MKHACQNGEQHTGVFRSCRGEIANLHYPVAVNRCPKRLADGLFNRNVQIAFQKQLTILRRAEAHNGSQLIGISEVKKEWQELMYLRAMLLLESSGNKCFQFLPVS